MAKRPKLLPQSHLAAIGAVAVYWSAIEVLMEQAILGLYEIDLGRGLVLTNNLNFHARMSLLRILSGDKESPIKDDALRKEIQATLARIDEAFGDRNFIVHGLWGPTAKPGIVNRMSIRARGKELKLFKSDYTAQAIWDVADRLGLLLGDFADLTDRLGVKRLLASAAKHSAAAK